MTEDSALPRSFFEGGEPQSKTNPGDPQRELIHEIRNLNTGLELLRHMFQAFLPVLEALEDLDTKLHHAVDTSIAPAEHAGQETEGPLDASDTGPKLI